MYEIDFGTVDANDEWEADASFRFDMCKTVGCCCCGM